MNVRYSLLLCIVFAVVQPQLLYAGDGCSEPGSVRQWKAERANVEVVAQIVFFLMNTRYDATLNQHGTPVQDAAAQTIALLQEKITPGFVAISPGTFQMGSPASEENRGNDEVRHAVTLTKAFELKATPVTEKEWRELMGNNPSFDYDNHPTDESSDDCPVQQVSWFDAVAYCNKLSELSGLVPYYHLSNEQGIPGTPGYSCVATINPAGKSSYRIPTEAEWEYAARAGGATARYGDLDHIAWYGDNFGFRTHPVGQKQANAIGLFDMLGNVYEWTSDGYGKYATGAQIDPQGDSTSEYRVIRGGFFGSIVYHVRAAYRNCASPADRCYNIGFRPARSLL